MREKKSGGQLVCIKQIHRVHHAKNSLMSTNHTKAFGGEAELMKKLRHPNLIRLLRSFIGPSPLRQQHLVMEYCSGGDLQSYFNEQRAIGLSEEKIWYWFIQLALGLHHMHQQRVLHRDLKTANIFLSDDGYLVLGDLGIARTLNNGDVAGTVIGTPLYMAPEVLDGKEYSFSSDVWALGCVLYELCTGKPPFTARTTPQLLNKICHGDYVPIQKGKHIQSSRLPTLVASMLRTRPDLRPSVDQLLRDSIARIHIRRYCVDRLQSVSMTEEERRVLVEQVVSLGVGSCINTKQEPIQVESYSRHKMRNDRDQEQQERKFMDQREQERQDQIRFALQRLQQLRLDFPAASPSKVQSDGSETPPPPPPLELKAEGWKVPIHDEQWREPVRTANDRSYCLQPRGRLNSVPKDVAFTGIPRPGVPFTEMAKTFASRRPVCRDVRALRKKENAKAAERYKRRLDAMKTPQQRKTEEIYTSAAPVRRREELTLGDGIWKTGGQSHYQNVVDK
ncbi:Serine/threonine-protein kinase Nek5 [Phytophthora citrophthora]|uniref:non-specific serine/threonine protein kinase n=1 Tax=Phytophthora citrophthora TaxID=4793 RepID=A0AAD9GPG1_9STRA|nr:Serine/threonine-protein kinase Nek5 [Phytophthora citrophthora]